MKRFTSWLILFLCCSNCFAQLKADAGADTVWCPRSWGLAQIGPQLGGTPAAMNGTPPYSYQWYYIGGISQMLDSVTSPRPRLINRSFHDSLFFILKVTDSTAAVAYDTVLVQFPLWICPAASCSLSKKAPDTISLQRYECRSQTPPYLLTFKYWSPATYLADSTDEHARCWAPVPIEYRSVSVNRFGCVSIETCNILITQTGIESTTVPDDRLEFLPNPLKELGSLECGKAWIGGRLVIFSTDGQEAINLKIGNPNTAFNADLLPAGIYFYRATAGSGSVKTGKLIKE